MVEVRLRELTLSDVPTIAALAYANAAHIAVGMRAPSNDVSELLRHFTWRYLASASGRRQEFVIEADGQLAGLASIIPIEAGQPGDREIALWIDQSHSGYGVGHAAVARLISASQGRQLFARIRTSNGTAQSIAEHYGFEPTSEAQFPPSDQMAHFVLPGMTDQE